MEGLLDVPRGWIEAFGEMAKFAGRIVSEVLRLRVLGFFGEVLRQTGVLIISYSLVIFGL